MYFFLNFALQSRLHIWYKYVEFQNTKNSSSDTRNEVSHWIVLTPYDCVHGCSAQWISQSSLISFLDYLYWLSASEWRWKSFQRIVNTTSWHTYFWCVFTLSTIAISNSDSCHVDESWRKSGSDVLSISNSFVKVIVILSYHAQATPIISSIYTYI